MNKRRFIIKFRLRISESNCRAFKNKLTEDHYGKRKKTDLLQLLSFIQE